MIVVNGGNRELFHLSDPETGFAVSLALGNGTVPAPRVDGARATFADIARDTDLVVEIRPAGYEYFLVLKSPEAAAASLDIPLVLTILGATMMPDDAGGFTLVDTAGALIGSMPPPTAWDAESDLKRGSPVLRDWSPTQESAPVTRALEKVAPADRVAKIRTFLASGADLQTQEIVEVVQVIAPRDAPGAFDVKLAVPAAWANDPATAYPLVLDPSGDTGAAFDTWVQGGYTSDQSGSPELKLGTYDSGSHIARSFLTFDWTDYQYTAVSAATLWLYEWHSWSCSATGWDAYIASPADTSTRWTSQPWYGYPYGLSYSTTGFSSSCDDNWVSMDITNLAQIWDGYPPGSARSVALAGDSETNNYNWKRFNSNEAGWGVPYLELTYTSTPPLAPTDITVGDQALTAAHRTDFAGTRPVFSAKVTDREGAPGYPRALHAVFVLYKDGVELGPYDGSTVASGGISTYTPTFDLEEGANYTLYVASVFNGTTVSTGIEGGGKFTTTSANPPAAPTALCLTGHGLPTAVATPGADPATFTAGSGLCGVREVIEPGDINGDGKNDLLMQFGDGSIRSYLGAGTGGVRDVSGTPVAGPWSSYPRVLAPGDWNSDGKVDLIGLTSDYLLIFHAGNGNGTFSPTGTQIGNGWEFNDIITPGDYDKDGKRDVIAVNSTGQLELYRGNGATGWISPWPVIDSGWGAFTTILTPGDFNHDANHNVDVIAWTKSTGELKFYAGPGAVTGLGADTMLGNAWSDYTQMIAPGDFNGDGYSDLLGLRGDGQLLLFAGDGGGGISTSGILVPLDFAPELPLGSVVVGDPRPAFSAVVSDPDGGQVRAVFSLYRRRANDTTWELVRNDLYGSWVTSGQRSYFRSSAATNDPVLEAALVAGNEYRVEVHSQDKARASEGAVTTGILTVASPGAAPDIPAGCDTFASPPSGSSTTCQG